MRVAAIAHREPFDRYTIEPIVALLGLARAVSLHLLFREWRVPKFIGSRVHMGPVAATVGMLFRSSVWGGVGSLLAVALTAFVKLAADCNPALLTISKVLAETPRPVARWAQAGYATVARAIPFLRDRFRVRHWQ
jgi:hypothetical protein